MHVCGIISVTVVLFCVGSGLLGAECAASGRFRTPEGQRCWAALQCGGRQMCTSKGLILFKGTLPQRVLLEGTFVKRTAAPFLPAGVLYIWQGLRISLIFVYSKMEYSGVQCSKTEDGNDV